MSGLYSGPGKLGRWQRLDSEKILETRIFDIRRDESRSPRTSRKHDFFVLETGDWVNIIPLTTSGEVVLIRQFRHGIGDFTLEIPGGMIDAEDASPLEAARREMREETGYDSPDVDALGWVFPNPAIQGNKTHMFVAKGAEKHCETAFDSTEETEVVLVPLAKVPELIAHSYISHALVICAFQRLGIEAEDGKQ